MMMLKFNLFIILTTFASIWDVSLEYPASTSKSTSSSSDQLLYPQPGISHYFDDSASSAFLTLPSEKLNPTHHVQSTQNRIQPIVKQPRDKDIINIKREKRVFCPSHRASLSAAWTDERKKKQSKLSRERMKGKNRSEESNMKVSKALTGRIISQSTRERFRKAQIGTHKSEATKQKIRESLKRTLERRKQMKEQQQQQQPKDL